MPLTTTGESVMESMKETYGSKKGKKVFYASLNKGKKGSEKWHRRRGRARAVKKMAERED